VPRLSGPVPNALVPWMSVSLRCQATSRIMVSMSLGEIGRSDAYRTYASRISDAVTKVGNAALADYRRSPLAHLGRVSVLLCALLFVIVGRPFWTPDVAFLVLLSIAAAFGQARPFLFRLLPFVGLLVLYHGFRSVADDLNEKVHFTAMIEADRVLFGGTLPTHTLQDWWWDGTVRWHDYYFYGLYTIHFLTPLLLAVVIWKFHDRLYWRFLWTFVGLNSAAFLTFLAFPAAPPWMASELGHISPLHRIPSDIWGTMGLNFSQIYPELSPNLVAAVPSLHSAYPLLIILVVAKLFGLRRTSWMFLYPFSVWVGVVYLGEHYVIDVVLGALYAVVAFAAFCLLGRSRDNDLNVSRRSEGNPVMEREPAFAETTSP
jgi:hypothetical protein